MHHAPRSFAPVTFGSPRFRAFQAGGIRVTEAAFTAGSVLPFHAHEKTVFSVILSGGFGLDFGSSSHECTAGTAFVEPYGASHSDRIGSQGARVLVMEIDPGLDRTGPLAVLLSEPRTFHDPEVGKRAVRLATRLCSECCSPLAVEADVLDLLSRAAAPFAAARHRAAGWLDRVREMLHANLDGSLRVGDLAREVGVHRVHLGRTFQARYGESIGDYHRRLRVQWAARQLAEGALPVALIALRAGFADHGHFTRVFKRLMGQTPRAYRFMASRARDR